jgi:hypothetical protein
MPAAAMAARAPSPFDMLGADPAPLGPFVSAPLPGGQPGMGDQPGTDPAPPLAGDDDGSAMDRRAAILHAADAVQRGADPDAVHARLIEMGQGEQDPPSPFSDLIPVDGRAREMTRNLSVEMLAGRATAQEGGSDEGSYPVASPQQYGDSLQRRSDPSMAPKEADAIPKYVRSEARGANAIGHAVPHLVDQPPNPAASGAGLNGYGYVPQRGDESLLARFLFAEFSRSDNWRDMPAGAWSAINRIRPTGHWPRYRTTDTTGTSLLDVLNKRGRDGTLQYSWLPPGGVGAPGGSRQWQASANPEALSGSDRQAWMWAVDTARRVLGGIDADRTGGATYFHNRSQGVPPNVRGRFHNPTTIAPAPYLSPNAQNFFYRHLEDPLRPIPWRPGSESQR